MCFSAAVSYGAAAVLLPTGLLALQQSRRLRAPYWALAVIPIFFGIQQAIEGRVWQAINSGDAAGAVPLALAYHFFSHFLWLWWIPLSSYLIEREAIRRRLFLGITIFGGVAGGLVYFALLFHPEWLSVEVEAHSIVYRVSDTWSGAIDVDIPFPASALYGLIILIPLLASSHPHIRRFGGLVVVSIVIASVSYGYAFVSVWCFFAAALSLYFVFVIRRLPQQA